MEELTLEEMIKYAMRIEQASVLFYKSASRRLEGNALKSLTDDFAVQEVEHLQELKKLLNNESFSSEEQVDTLNVDTALFDRIITANEIPAQATPANVLRIALSWEMNTGWVYEKLIGLSGMSSDIVKVLKKLRDMEGMHVLSIKERMDQLKVS